VLHRPLEGKPKTVCVRRSTTGKWSVTFACEGEPTPLPASEEALGIDVGLHAFAAFSTGEAPIANPRFFRRDEEALHVLQAVCASGANCGLRLSRNACAPSRWSAAAKAESMRSAACS